MVRSPPQQERCEIDPAQIVAGSPIPTFVLDADHRIIHYNHALERLTGLRSADLIGTREQWRAFYPSPRPVMADLLLDRAGEAEIRALYGDKFRPSAVIEGAYEAEDYFPAIGGGGRWLFFTAAPITDGRGGIVAAIETLQDISLRKRAETLMADSRRRYRAFIDFIPYPVAVSDLEGRVAYVNPAFTQMFGWTLGEIQGQKNPYIPETLEGESAENLRRLKTEKVLQRYVTRRAARDGDLKTVAITASIYAEFQGDPSGTLEIMRDITLEIAEERRKEMILRVSRSLPEYPDLEGLLDFISREIKQMLDTEGALVILLDEEKQELYFLGAAYDDAERERRAKEIRFRVDELTAGRVIRTGEPLIVNDTTRNAMDYPERDRRFGYHTKNFLLVPLRSGERIIGVLGALNIKSGRFTPAHMELLAMLAGTVALSIENARFSDEIRKAYQEVISLNRARDKAVTHLSHELKTPLSVMAGSLAILERKLSAMPGEGWRPTFTRVARNLDRMIRIQEEVEDIMQGSREHAAVVSVILEQSLDLIETLLEKEAGERVASAVRARIEAFYGPRRSGSEVLSPVRVINERIDILAPFFAHRAIEVVRDFAPVPEIFIPPEVFIKTIDGLIRNAVENTPDEGRIEIGTRPEGGGARIEIRDSGVGVPAWLQERIFEGFVHTQSSQAYASRRPFDFNAGGKGADLLRMKIFSERCGFTLGMHSERCRFIPREEDVCPGRIGGCAFCADRADCLASGGTVFFLWFPAIGDRR
ncbi:PAS domain-containing sensor histidine kinase [Desulfococcus sp.]|uniref:PAS domain-containing sensor histidine kinase n=1 Tax=Desulfococcus sp. TaxID=2025834 RepID=UPI0035940B79